MDQLPKWKCHKVVRAAKISAIENSGTVGMLVLQLQGQDPEAPLPVAEVDAAWFVKFKPEVGGYLVVYDDGYMSYSPAKAFEEGYALVRDAAS